MAAKKQAETERPKGVGAADTINEPPDLQTMETDHVAEVVAADPTGDPDVKVTHETVDGEDTIMIIGKDDRDLNDSVMRMLGERADGTSSPSLPLADEVRLASEKLSRGEEVTIFYDGNGDPRVVKEHQ